MRKAIENRYEFVILFDVENGNPNGDPDAGNMPRIDAETNFGIVTDVCIKRKLRNYVELVKEDCENFKIYIKEGTVLNTTNKIAYDRLNILDGKDVSKDDIAKLRKFMCDNYYDVRTFGAVMSTDVNCGIVRGPVQINFARSIDPIFQQEITITRMAITNEKDAKNNNTMGRKFVIPYALYRTEGYISASLAKNVTGFSEEDLELLFEALENMFENDHSAARGKMSLRKLVVFKHASVLGNCPANKLFDLITVKKINADAPTRKYSDYVVSIDKNTPNGVELIERV
ncbi:type I-C CRISPR-associated protein Cas7/Csd2 [bacterium]|jgi:CRISPR-associated protein Csd2|nr:type I-C CRISPR-associated protein Cas7/Csd2 [bacterium]